MLKQLICVAALLIFITSCTENKPKQDDEKNKEFKEEKPKSDTVNASLSFPAEKHFKNIRQLTFAANNAEGYFSFDDKSFSFQSDNPTWANGCDQIYNYPLTGEPKDKTFKPDMISTGQGRTTCAFFLPGDTEILYASTHEGSKDCLKPAQRKDHKYVWPLYDTYDIYVANLKGKIRRKLTNQKGYDAEATVSPKGDKIVFTSMRSGDPELWLMNLDGTGLKQLTHELGYDGGGSFSPDGKEIVFRASRPKTKEDVAEYKSLLKEGLVMPIKLELFTIKADGSGLKQITTLGKANWAPCFHPSGKKIIFASNHAGKKGFNFNLYLINTDGTGLEKVSDDKVFDAFPMFSHKGDKLIFCSNRHNGGGHDTNLFIADWVE
ncbi:MAG: hypothetical protein NTX03_01950 [Bacteroidetes bacterium]|nr:hypothetical protein [Bacteroidota bacterium]